MKTGVFGGTFDPPHIGHLIAAQDASIDLELDRVLFVLAARPPHKEGQPVTPASIRLDMLKAALNGCGRFEVCLLELEREGPSYTVDTLRALRDQDPDQELYLLIGADQVAALPGWHEPAQIARLAHIVALTRSGREMRGQRRHLHRKVRVTRIDVSSSVIRQRVAQNQPIRYLVPQGVETIISERGLYRAAVPNGDAPPGVAE